MNLHNKNSSTLSLYSLRGKSWSYFQKHITNLLDNENDGSIGSMGAIGSPTPTNNALYEHRADVQRLDIKDYELYGISPSDPGPMVLCNQCSHIMAPEGIARHVKRVHGTKIVPAASSKSRIAMLLASRAHSTTGSVFASNSNASITNNSLTNSCSTSSLTTAFSNRLNLSKMAPPGKSLNSDECKQQPTSSTASSMNSMPAISSNAVHSSVSAALASTMSSSSNSNSNSPTSSLKTATSGTSSNGGRRNRKILPIKYREYDPEKHCGVIVGNMKPCTRSLTCKTHQISLRRNVDGRSKPFDQLLAEHRNNAKDGVPKSSSSRQLNSLDNSNQLALDSIADSNSSSSFDLERRSFSSNSNQSSYNNEHVYPPQTPSNHSMSGLTLMSSSASSSTTTLASLPITTSNSSLSQNRKPLQPSFSIDDAAMNNTAIEAMDGSSSSASIMQIQSSNNLNASATNLNNLSDYSVQINQLNDLIDDDNGDCLDMSFWESFDNNFTYENDLLATNSSQTQPQAPQQSQQQQHQQHQQQSYDAKTGVKRSMSQIYEASLQDSSVDRKRKRGNDSPAIKSNQIRERLKKSPSSQDMAISMSVPRHVSPDFSAMRQSLHGDVNFGEIADTCKFGGNVAKDGETWRNPATIPNGGIYRDQIATAHQIGSVGSQHRTEDKRDATMQKKRSVVNVKKSESIVAPQDKTTKSSSSPDSALHIAPMANSRLNVKTQDAMIPMRQEKRPEIDEGEGDDDDDSYIQLMAEAPQPLQTMVLSSSDEIVQSTDLKTITKMLSESDHRTTPAHTTPGDSKSQTITAVPIDENENYLLDIVYKCLRGKGDRTINSTYANGGAMGTAATINGNSSSTSNGSIGSSHRNTGTGSRISSAIGVDKEKENALEQQSDDESAPTFAASSTSAASGTSGGSSNSLLIPAAQRYSTKIHHVGLPRPIDTNRFGMARGRGISQFKHAIDSTKKTQQQIFHRLQSQQPNGTTYSGSFTSASMIALRNNGSLMRFNPANLLGAGVAGIVSSAAVNNGIAIGTTKGANATTASDQNAMTKGAAKKGSSTATNVSGSGVVLVSADTSSSVSSSGTSSLNAPMTGNQTHYAILRRQPTAKQSMQILSTRAANSEPTNFSVMPVIHRVRARTMTPNVPKNLQAQTDALLQNLPKSMRVKMLASTLLAMVAKKPVIAPCSSSSSSSASATQSNATSAPVSVSNANSSSSGTSLSTVKSNASVRQPSKLSHTSSFSHKTSLSSSVSSSAALKNVKQNGHYSAAGSSTGDTIYTVNSLARSSGSSASGASPSYHRSGSSHRSSASLLQMQNSPSIDALILPKIIS